MSIPLLVVLVGALTAVVAVVLGIVALVQINRSKLTPAPRGGKGLAIAGISLGAATLVIAPLLAAIAIPVFLNQRDAGQTAAVQVDLRNAATAEETWLLEHGTYTDSVADLQQYGFKTSSTTKELRIVTDGSTSYCIQAASSLGSIQHYESGSGLGAGSCP